MFAIPNISIVETTRLQNVNQSELRLQNVGQSKLLQCPTELLKLIIAFLRDPFDLKRFSHTCSMLFHMVDAMDWFALCQIQNPTLAQDRLSDYDMDYWKRIALKRISLDNYYDYLFK
ncbi:hypothetical protein BGX28_005459, partial [Mortierella sp. GBA30]